MQYSFVALTTDYRHCIVIKILFVFQLKPRRGLAKLHLFFNSFFRSICSRNFAFTCYDFLSLQSTSLASLKILHIWAKFTIFSCPCLNFFTKTCFISTINKPQVLQPKHLVKLRQYLKT